MQTDAPPPPAQLTRQNTNSNRRSKTDEEGAEVVEPGCFSRNLVKRPCCFMWVTFIVAIFLAIIPIGSGRMTVSFLFAIMLDSDTVPLQVDFRAHERIADSDDIYSAPGATVSRESFDLPLYFYYEALNADRNMFSPEQLESVASYERALLEMPEWPKHCWNATSSFGPNAGETRCASPYSVLRFLYTNAAKQQEECEAGFCFADTEARLASCRNNSEWGTFPCMSTVYDWRTGTLAEEAQWPALLEQVFDNPALSYSKAVLLQKDAKFSSEGHAATRYIRSLYQVFSPYNESETRDGRGFADMEEQFVKDLVKLLDDTKDELSATKILDHQVATGGKPVNIWWSGLWTTQLDILSQLSMADMTLAVFSVIVVAIILIINTGSILLSLAGLFEIIIAIFLAMFCWVLCAQTQVTALELMGIFLILCVGADDIFVFCDTWKESAVMPPNISGSLLTRFSWTYSRAAGAMLTTTATTAISLFISGFSAFPMVQAFGLFNMFIVICDYLLVITWFAAVTVCLERLASQKCAPGRNWEFSCCCPGKAQAEKTERRTTAWFKNTLAPAAFKGRWVLLAFSLATMAGGIAVCASIFEDGELRNLDDTHPGWVGVGGRINLVSRNEFGDADQGRVQVYGYYGLRQPPVKYPKSINIYQSDPDGNNFEDYQDAFELQFADGRFGPAEQEKMVADCDGSKLNNETISNLVYPNEVHCLLTDLKAHVGAAFPYSTEAELRRALEAFYASDRYKALTTPSSPEYIKDYDIYTGFLTDGDDGIATLWHSFNSTIPTTTQLSSTAISPYADEWARASDIQCTENAPCMLTDRYGFFEYKGVADATQASAIQNIFIALVVAYFILMIFTTNFLVPLIAILSIGSTITWVLATILLLGYKFEIVASILLVMIVGMSVDYAAHMVHFYNEMDGDRYQKVQGALHGVGVSVIGGALTTGGAAVPLLFTVHFTFFEEMGFFILFTAIWGVFFTFLQLVPILMICGPVGEAGDVRAAYRRIRGAIKGGPGPAKSSETASATGPRAL